MISTDKYLNKAYPRLWHSLRCSPRFLIAIQLIIVIIGCYAGFKLRIQAGYLFALAFLLFAVYDITSMMGYGDDMLAIINILAAISALGGIYLLVKQA